MNRLAPAFGQADLTTCDRELVHLPGCIQPHGVLLVLEEPTLTILQTSSNTLELLGVAAGELLDRPIDGLVGEEELADIREALGRLNLDANPLYLATLQVGAKGMAFQVAAHRLDGLLYLELEPVLPSGLVRTRSAGAEAREIMAELMRAPDLATLCHVAARRVRALTGHDRAWVYRFHEDNHGEVIAEDRNQDLPSFFGLHYPATDIPAPARSLFLLNWLRLIPDAHATPADLLPAVNPQTGNPLDMTYCALRAVSPIHIEYIKNMGCSATMSLSLVHQGRLWGLISCQSTKPGQTPHDVRATCELLAQMVSLQLGAAEAQEDADYKLHLRAVVEEAIAGLAETDDVVAGLAAQSDHLYRFVRSDGFAIVTPDRLEARGETPAEAMLQSLAEWLPTMGDEPVRATNALATLHEPAAAVQDIAAGLLAVQISSYPPITLFWFRPEVVRTVQWGVNPNKEKIEQTPEGARIHPRRSFDLWRETVGGRSLPWQRHEVEAARDLRNGVLNVVLRRTAAVERLNAELELRNLELDSFAYVASHDLKEPLRGIHNYASLLLEDYGDRLDEEGRRRLAALLRLTRRMEDLLDSLLHYSRLGRRDLHRDEADLHSVLNDALDTLRGRLEESGTEVRVLLDGVRLPCDRVLVSELFVNVIANAIKYNDSGEPRVEIGLGAKPDDSGARIIYVRDNGIGIPPRHHEAIFSIFRRLHPRESYGGGAGAGLTIAHKIVERHGGRIWVESAPGEGSTFFFTLGPGDAQE